jgi:hypothetical protein
VIPIDLTELAAYARLELTDEGHAMQCYRLAREMLAIVRRTLRDVDNEPEFSDRRSALLAYCVHALNMADDMRRLARRWRADARRRAR